MKAAGMVNWLSRSAIRYLFGRIVFTIPLVRATVPPWWVWAKPRASAGSVHDPDRMQLAAQTAEERDRRPEKST